MAETRKEVEEREGELIQIKWQYGQRPRPLYAQYPVGGEEFYRFHKLNGHDSVALTDKKGNQVSPATKNCAFFVPVPLAERYEVYSPQVVLYEDDGAGDDDGESDDEEENITILPQMTRTHLPGSPLAQVKKEETFEEALQHLCEQFKDTALRDKQILIVRRSTPKDIIDLTQDDD